jgi:hypothetical protein
MNSSSKEKISFAIWAVAVLVFVLASFAVAADNKNKPSAPAPHQSAPAARPAAPAQHPGGAQGGNMQRPTSGPGGNNMNRGPGGQNGSMNRGPGGNMNNNMNRGGNQNQPANRNVNGNNNMNRGGNQNQPGNRNVSANANRHQPTGSRTVNLRNGGSATFRANGQVRTIQSHGMTINRGMNGQRRVVATHNGRTVVSYGHGAGYSQRAFYRNGNRVYVQRTYFYGGRSYAYAYRSYYWGGRPYYGYAPAYYWRPAYYGWAYNPWPAPVYYGWGWGGAPWYGYYGPYWAPYPAYPSAAFWLTDFFVAASLQAAYAAGQQSAENGVLIRPQINDESALIASLWSSDPLVAGTLASAYGPGAYLLSAAAQTAAAGGTAMSAEVKQGIADEIKNQIAAEKDAAANQGNSGGNDSGPPAALDPNIRYFVVASEEDLTTSDGTECTLTGGDVVYRTGDQPDNDNMVDATVKSSKKGECSVGATVGVAVDDLQDMYNNLRQNLSQGLKEMADNSGKNGLPKAPDTTTTAGEVPAPTPDSNVQNDLNQTQQDADQAEAEAKQPPNN